MKFRLGLFDRPVRRRARPRRTLARPGRRRGAGRPELAERSLVLLENDGVLPLAPDLRRVAVIGPIADSARDLLGDYSHLVHMETLQRDARRGVDALGVIGDGEVVRARRRADRPADDPRCAAGARCRRGGRPRPRDRASATGPTRSSRRPSRSPRDADVAIVVARRAIGPDRRLDDRRVPRPRRARASSAASRSCSRPWSRPGRRSCSSSSAAGRSRSTWAAGHCAAILLAWVPGDAGPDADRRRAHRGRRTRAASCRSRCRATSGRCR